MKLKVQAQHLQPGDIVGSGEVVRQVIVNSIQFPSNKVKVTLFKNNQRTVLWGKYTMINVERKEKPLNRLSEDSVEHFDRYIAGDR